MPQPDLITSAPPRTLGTKPKGSIYTALLCIALAAILLGCLFLWMEIKLFGGFGAVKGRVSSARQPAVMMLVGAGEKYEIRISKFETNSKHEYQNPKPC